MKLEDAILLAVQWQARLMPYCERVEIAGSVRRKKPEVHDIEIVAAPMETEIFDPWTGELKPFIPLYDAIWNSQENWSFTLKKNGPRFKQLDLGEITVDLFIVLPPAMWGVIYAIRTGPAEFSHWLVTTKQKGGALPSYLKVRDGALWHGDEVIQTPEEKDFFRAIGVEMVRPEERVAGWKH